MIPKFMANNLHRVRDIIHNYKPVQSSCDRAKQIAKQAYFSVTDYHEHYSKLTDLTSFAAAKIIYQKMAADQTGRAILQQKPRITDEVFNNLSGLQENTFGHNYYSFMSKQNFKPSERPIVQFIPDLQYAYVLQRYKEIHDFLHILLAKKISVNEELLIKWFEMRQLGLPSATLAALSSPLLSNREDLSLSEIARIISIADRSKFVMNIYYEKLFHLPLDQVRKDLGFQ